MKKRERVNLRTMNKIRKGGIGLVSSGDEGFIDM